MTLAYLNLIPIRDQAAFGQGVRAIAGRLGIQPDWLMRVMYRESELNPAARNGSSGATGLIQFTSSSAHDVGTTLAALANMSAVQQLPFVEKYYRSMIAARGIKPRSVYDLYLLTLYPKAAGKADGYVVFKRGTTAYAQNSGINPAGDVTVADVKKFVDGVKPPAPLKTNAITIFGLGTLALAVLVIYSTFTKR